VVWGEYNRKRKRNWYGIVKVIKGG